MEPDYQALLTGFLEQERLRGRRTTGLQSLRRTVPKLFDYLSERGLALDFLSVAEAQDYQGWLQAKGRLDGQVYSPRTVLSYLTAAGTLYDYLLRQGQVRGNPFREMDKLRTPKTLPRETLTVEQMQKLLEALRDYQALQLKTAKRRYLAHVVCELLYATGMRITEACALRPEDLDLGRGVVHIREGKGGYDRQAFLNEYAQNVLQTYLVRIRPVFLTAWHDRQRLFGLRSDQFGKQINAELKRVCLNQELPVITSHGFRHAVGFHLLRSGCSIRHIQAILGHQRLRSTEVYTRVDREDLKAVLDTYLPRQWNGPK